LHNIAGIAQMLGVGALVVAAAIAIGVGVGVGLSRGGNEDSRVQPWSSSSSLTKSTTVEAALNLPYSKSDFTDDKQQKFRAGECVCLYQSRERDRERERERESERETLDDNREPSIALETKPLLLVLEAS
jgi:hypothetical protein